MSEYWKSTVRHRDRRRWTELTRCQPKYWCKHCKAFVRDTKLERQQHDATPKHQGNLKRFLRDLHRGHEREDRDRERAKREVERLNGVVGGTQALPASSSAEPSSSKRRSVHTPAPAAPRQVTAEERKRQVAQLADLGVSIPQEFRGEMAMTGEWQTVSQTLIGPGKHEDEEEHKDGRIVGVRKRKAAGFDDDPADHEEAAVRVKWVSTIKTYPGSQQDDDVNLDALLKGKKPDGASLPNPVTPENGWDKSKVAGGAVDEDPTADAVNGSTPVVKEEDPSELERREAGPTATEAIVFKKRKSRPIRQKG